MTIKKAVMAALDKYLEGGYTWFGKASTWLPNRDPVAFEKRVAKTKVLRSGVDALDVDDEAFELRLSALIDAFKKDVAAANCSSQSLQYMLADIKACMGSSIALTTNPAYQQVVGVASAPQRPERVAVTEDKSECGAEETKPAESEALVAVADKLWHYPEFVAEALPEDKPSALSLLLRQRAQMTNDVVRNTLLSDRGRENFERMNYFERLGVEQHVSPDAIRRAYRQLSLRLHPDKVGVELQAHAKAIMAMVNEAYATLGCDERRGRYVSHLMSMQFMQENRSLAIMDQDRPHAAAAHSYDIFEQPGCLAMLGLWPVVPGMQFPLRFFYGMSDAMLRGFDAFERTLDELEDALNPTDPEGLRGPGR